jgi:hypothetical protein
LVRKRSDAQLLAAANGLEILAREGDDRMDANMTDLRELLLAWRDAAKLSIGYTDWSEMIKATDAALAQPPDAKPVAWIIEHETPSNRPDEPPEHYRGVTLVDPQSHEGAYYGDETITPLYAAPRPPAGKGDGLQRHLTAEEHDVMQQALSRSSKLIEKSDAIPREIHERLIAEKEAALEELRGYNEREYSVARAAIAEKDAEIERLKAGAGWLAQLVIDKLGGTQDLDGWVKQSARCYAETIERAEAAEAALARAKAQALREAAEWFRQRHNKSDPTPWRDAMSYPESLLERMASEHERGG